jgi:predicted RNA-binding Zn-ribbon protein involved in translation (DUF1610 family)
MKLYYTDPDNGVNIDAAEISYWHCPVCGDDGIRSWSICREHPDAGMVFGLGVDCVVVTIEELRQRELLT